MVTGQGVAVVTSPLRGARSLPSQDYIRGVQDRLRGRCQSLGTEPVDTPRCPASATTAGSKRPGPARESEQQPACFARSLWVASTARWSSQDGDARSLTVRWRAPSTAPQVLTRGSYTSLLDTCAPVVSAAAKPCCMVTSSICLLVKSTCCL